MANLVWDSFNRANGAIGNADSGQAWVASGAKPLYVQSNVCIGDAAGALEDCHYIDCGQSDVFVQAELYLSASSGLHCGLVWRLADADNYHLVFLFYNGGTNYRLYYARFVAGSWEGLTYVPYVAAPGSYVTCRIEARGANHKIYFDGVEEYDFDSAAHQTATGVGILLDSSTQWLDDFLAGSFESPQGLSGLSGLSGLGGLV